MAAQQQALQELSESFQKLQAELQTTIEARQKLESQFQENKSVKKELDQLHDDANVYKLVGPVLLKQASAEANLSVKGRLDYIEKEMKRVEDQIKSLEGAAEAKKSELYQLQASAQSAA